MCSFTAFSAHPLKVRRSVTPTRACSSCVSPSTVPVPPSEGAQMTLLVDWPQKHLPLYSRHLLDFVDRSSTPTFFSPVQPRIPIRKVQAETAYLHHLLEFVMNRPASCRNGRESRDLVPLRNEGGLTRLRRRPVAGVRGKMSYRNGRELRDLLPLWKGNGRGKLLRMPVSWVMWRRLCRNGRELRDLLPLRFHSAPARERK